MKRQLSAIVALAVGAATIILAVAVAVSEFPRGLAVLGCVLLAGAAAWYGVLRRGVARVAGLTVAGLALAGAVALIVVGGGRFVDLLVLAGFLVSVAAARATLNVHVDLPSASAPSRPVLFFNPRSGGGKAERFKLADEARKRGIEPIELGPPWDLEALVRGAVARGADALAMAGGDGSQAIVAAIAAELGLPYACIPAGTRNHFALDLGVDRDDVVGALDAFVDGGERTVDLAEVNGRVFVNNVSLGLYAEAVQREEYRDAKLHTLLDTVPDVLGPDGAEKLDLRFERSGRADAPFGCNGAGLQQPIPARPRDRLGHAPADRRRPARDHSRRRTYRARRARPIAAAPAARVVRADVRGRLGPADRRRHRRRGADARRAAALSHPTWSPARARCAQAPGRITLGHGPRRAMGRRGRAGANRRRPPPETPNHSTEEARMDLIEITEKERLSREDAAARLHALADMLAKHNDVEFERGGLRFKVHVADEVDFKLEVEIGDDERELEIELKW